MTEPKKSIGYIAVSDIEKSSLPQVMPTLLKEEFKGNVSDVEVNYPKELGTVHPFDFNKVEQIINNVGIVSSAVDKITDYIIGDFIVKTNDPKTQTILDNFVEESNFKTVIRPWIKEGLSKGNGFMELDLKESKVRVMNANWMWVQRNKKGKVLRYNQYIGNKNKINMTSNNVTEFKVNEIAHLPVNKIPNDAYGIGLVNPNMRTINNYATSEMGLHKVIERKAGAPIHVKVGVGQEGVQDEDVDAFKASLQYLTNSTEWVTDANVEMSVLDFKDVGKNLTDASNHDVEQFSMGMQIPMVLLGVANVPEGLAKVQMEAFQRFTNALRKQIEDIIEDKIMVPVLRANGLDADVEFEWELPGEEEKNLRLDTIAKVMVNPFLSPELKAALEIEYAQILGLEMENLLVQPKDAQAKADEEIKKQEDAIKQPEVPGEKPTAKESSKVTVKEKVECSHTACNLTESQISEMTLAEYVNITEIPGFNYTDYLVKILQQLKTYKFQDLLAITEKDLIEGLLPANEIEKLRIVLKNGFRKNLTITQIEKEISQKMNVPDRVKLEEDGSKRVTLSSEARPKAIARTETVRLANAGLKDLYQENGIQHYRYLAALDDRTSAICQELNGQVFLVSEGSPGNNMPPMHVNCRSTIVGLVD